MCGLLAYAGHIDATIEAQLRATLDGAIHRGPDHSAWERVGPRAALAFQRLAIRGLSSAGNQPLRSIDGRDALVCNGEVYNESELRRDVGPDATQCPSDCHVILPLVRRYGLRGACERLDAEFAFAMYEGASGKVLAARDPIGIRPLFYGYTHDGRGMLFASEAKFLTSVCSRVRPFPPGHYFDGEAFLPYRDPTAVSRTIDDHPEVISSAIERLLVEAVRKRLVADVPVGFLLSGGLDSSLVCAIAARLLPGRIRSFAVGMTTDAIDLKYAQQVADHIDADHTAVYVDQEQALTALREVIYHLETWDITTIRASIGMYLVCKHIRANTDIKVLLTGEVSDELFGYKYTDFAPSAAAFQEEAAKRVRELHLYDVLRADRCISAHSMEARVPFGDLDFASYVMSIDPELKLNRSGQGKALLRQAFAGKRYLPERILRREKAAFSDAMGHSLVDSIQAFARATYGDDDVQAAVARHPHCPPFSAESLLYRDIFESLFPGRGALIPAYWMPNREWENCDVADPSARFLPNYGASGL